VGFFFFFFLQADALRRAYPVKAEIAKERRPVQGIRGHSYRVQEKHSSR
jgi:hypothetical protein